MITLGIHAALTASVHDPAVSVVRNGELIATIEEERLSRVKTSVALFPERSLRKILSRFLIDINDVSLIGVDGVTWRDKGKPRITRYIRSMYGECPKIAFYNHELSHVAGAFFSSPFDRAICISLDGNGDGLSGLVTICNRNASQPIRILKSFEMPNSLGVFYTVMTNYLGFRSIEDEFKVMGMAAYGRPVYDLSELLWQSYDNLGTFYTHPKLWETALMNTTVWEPKCNYELIQNIIGIGPRLRDAPFNQEHFDLAASVQLAFQKVYISVIEYWLKFTKERNLVLTGGCALNCMANKTVCNLPIDDLYVFPAASDRGLSVGNAYLASSELGVIPKYSPSPFLGLDYSKEEVNTAVLNSGLPFTEITKRKDLIFEAASALLGGLVIGWFSGRSELGPRALGARSILALASISGMRDTLNKKIKFREAYRPFAPVLLRSDVIDYDIIPKPLTAMKFMTVNISVPAGYAHLFSEAMSVDQTARVQLVSHDEPLFDLLVELKKHLKIPVLINTSFNLAGEPNVESPVDAIRTFTSSGLDKLFFDSMIVSKGILA